ncbi:MAG: 5'/3'-nucleotidase SurE [Sulfobacillus acidophilus]|uniref:5'-nucleotidase SurE n=1 Tax=Sulfobacillus acidophilus TaxID=53633 RepID=A0A2T2WFD6_9FIRM|nr:MAG: 5'/3'-nucleotidase SurE [Sulfobacillus acidophilus]
MNVLVTNDDGIGSDGLLTLVNWLRSGNHEIMVVAPEQNASGQSGAITLGKPVRVTPIQPQQWAVAGTPADCVRIALGFLGFHPDLVVSGVNHGANLGQDVLASGTVGAAMMAAVRGIPAAAFSASSNDWVRVGQLLARHGPRVVAEALSQGPKLIVSVNFPQSGGDRLVVTELSGPRYDDEVQWEEFDGQHHMVRLMMVERTKPRPDANDDVGAIMRGFSTLSYIPSLPSVSVVPALYSSKG